MLCAVAGISIMYQEYVHAQGRHGSTGKEAIEASVVYADRDVKAIVRDMSRFFSVNYAKDYISSLTAIRTVSSGEKYRQLMCVTGMWGSTGFTMSAPGLYFDDRHSYDVFYPADAFVSNCYFPDRQEINSLRVTTRTTQGLESLYTDMDTDLSLSVLVRKRALELYSPLNPKHVKDFTYSVEEVREGPSGREYVIAFRSREGVFPGKNRLYGSGILHISEDGLPMKIEIADMEERYSRFIRQTDPPLPVVTPYRFSVEYALSQGKIHVRSVRQEVRWMLPEGVSGQDAVFYAERPPFRNPFKYGMSTVTDIIFGEPYFFDGRLSQDEDIRESFMSEGISEDVCCYVEGIDHGFWNRVLGSCLDMDKVREDLDYEGMTLEEQAEANAAASMDKYRSGDYITGGSWEQFERRVRSEYRYSRELYRLVYGKEYHEDFPRFPRISCPVTEISGKDGEGSLKSH